MRAIGMIIKCTGLEFTLGRTVESMKDNISWIKNK